jgi:hypothetical protein
MIESSCHCGSVQLRIEAEAPTALTSCNCSICRRYGSLMAYFSPKQVEVVTAEGATERYVWGDKMLAFVRCAKCGCFSHWEGLDPNSSSDRMGVNSRLFTNLDISTIRVRRFDGANTWTFLD